MKLSDLANWYIKLLFMILIIFASYLWCDMKYPQDLLALEKRICSILRHYLKNFFAYSARFDCFINVCILTRTKNGAAVRSRNLIFFAKFILLILSLKVNVTEMTSRTFFFIFNHLGT